MDGVKEVGKEVLEGLLGGVRERVGSLIVVECDDDGSNAESGDRFGGVGWGMVVSKSSARSKVENVRFASSAMNWIRIDTNFPSSLFTYSFENEARHEVYVSSASRVWLESHHREAG